MTELSPSLFSDYCVAIKNESFFLSLHIMSLEPSILQDINNIAVLSTSIVLCIFTPPRAQGVE